MAGGEQHQNEAALLKFLQRSDQSSAYVRETAQWLRKKYPGSAGLIPKLRQLYQEKKRAGM